MPNPSAPAASPRTAVGRRAVLALSAAATLGLAVPSAALAAPAPAGGSPGAVYVQLNAPSGNEIAVYGRAADGRLTAAGRFATGGLGGTAVDAPVDALASQDSLVLADGGQVLLAVNAGSNTVTSFRVDGTGLERASVVPSGGAFPVSVAVHDDLVYVLNAGGTGTVSGFRLTDGRLVPIPRSTRSLGLANTTPPVFITAPGQVGFRPDGAALVVTTKGNGTILGFAVRPDDRLAASPVVTTSAGPVPFSFAWTGERALHVTQAGDGRLASYTVLRSGATVLRGTSEPSGGRALCWVVRAGATLVGANTGSGTLTAWTVGTGGVASLGSALAATPGGAPIDLASTANGTYVYAQDASTGTLTVYRHRAGSLKALQTVTGLPVFDGTGMEGIAAR